jgi:hypothetical protein
MLINYMEQSRSEKPYSRTATQELRFYDIRKFVTVLAISVRISLLWVRYKKSTISNQVYLSICGSECSKRFSDAIFSLQKV